MADQPGQPAEETIFTKIIKGDIPSHKIYEDERVCAFLDIFATQPGYTLVVPKKQVQFVWDLEAADYQALMSAVQRIALRLRQVMGTPYVGEKIVGVDVPHSHVHLIPFATVEEYNQLPNPDSEPDHAALAEIAAKLQF